MEFSAITNLAIDAAKSSAEILKKGFYAKKEISSKSQKHDFVTQYDKLSEKNIITRIQKHYPDHSFLAEESGLTNRGNSIQWVIDPLDGTVNFVHGIPVFAVSIAAYHNNDPICGVILQPLSQELFVAEKGKGAYLNKKPIEVTKTKALDDSFLATGFPYLVKENPHHCFENLLEVLKRGIPLRRIGAAAIDLAYVAAGIFDGFWEMNLGPWDYAAGKIIIEEAKGKLTHWSGEEIDLTKHKEIVATNGALHEEFLQLLGSKK